MNVIISELQDLITKETDENIKMAMQLSMIKLQAINQAIERRKQDELIAESKGN